MSTRGAIRRQRQAKREILCDFIYPPVPFRDHDWQARTEDYEPGHPLGYGPTEEAARADLLEQLDPPEWWRDQPLTGEQMEQMREDYERGEIESAQSEEFNRRTA